MPIKRSKALADFFVMHNATAQDNSLSWAARGMLAYLLSKPEGWTTSMADITRQSKAGKKACQTAFKELLDAGYAVRNQEHRNGRLVWETTVHDRPYLAHKTASPVPAQIQCIENVPAQNRVVYKEQTVERTDIERTEKEESVASDDAPSLTDEQKILRNWNEMAAELSLPMVEVVNPARRAKMKARLREVGLDGFRRAFEAIEESKFLRGENDKGWTATFDFVVSPSGMAKIIEGNYGNE